MGMLCFFLGEKEKGKSGEKDNTDVFVLMYNMWLEYGIVFSQMHHQMLFIFVLIA